MILASLALLSAASGPFEDLDALDRQVAAIAPAQPIDRRLKLRRCPAPVVIEPFGGRGLSVSCAAIGWRIFVATAPMNTPSQGPLDIRRGDVVSLQVPGEGFVISTSATALDDARAGQMLRLKMARDSAVISAEATGAGQARMPIDKKP
ncbi:MAG: hypothetical protein RL425_1502 [Pseudomonadota bacterium]